MSTPNDCLQQVLGEIVPVSMRDGVNNNFSSLRALPCDPHTAPRGTHKRLRDRVETASLQDYRSPDTRDGHATGQIRQIAGRRVAERYGRHLEAG